MPWYQQPFFQVALPIIVVQYLGYWALRDAINDVKKEIKEIKDLLREHGEDIAILKDRAGLVRVK
jgi:hypothetical protein